MRIRARTESLSQTARVAAQCVLAIMVNVLLIVVAGNVCWEAIDLSHNEELALSAYGDQT
jgi:hypothetical protein